LKNFSKSSKSRGYLNVSKKLPGAQKCSPGGGISAL